MTYRPIITVAALVAFLIPKAEEKANIKTNLLDDVVGTVNAGVEIRLNDRWSLDLGGAVNPWTFSDGVKYKRWTAMPELRYWFGTAMHGHFMSLHLLGGEYNYQGVTLPFNRDNDLRHHRYEGWYAGAGLAYGYRWNFNDRLGMEGVIGAGYTRVYYDKYACGHCGQRIATSNKNRIGITRFALNLIYRFGKTPAKQTGTIPPTVVHDTIYIERHAPASLPADLPPTAPTVHRDSLTLRLGYPLDGTEIVPSLGDNRAMLDSLRTFLDRYAADPSLRISNIDIGGYASVEGPAGHNLELSEGRAQSVAQYIGDIHPTLSGYIRATGHGEDWQSLTFEGKEQLMQIADPDDREAILRTVGDGRLFETLLNEQLPRSRRIILRIDYTLIESD